MVNTLVGLLRREPERLEWTTVVNGRAVKAVRAIAEAGRDVVLGDMSRFAGVDDAIERLDATGHHYSAAMFRRARVLLAPDDPGAAAQARAAAAWFRSVGAVAPLKDLERYLEPDRATGVLVEEPARA